MANKIVKAKCRISGTTVALQVNEDKKVVGLYRLTPKDAAVRESEIDECRLSANPCPSCGCTKQGGCDCGKKQLGCKSGSLPSKYCATCKEMIPDYSYVDTSGIPEDKLKEIFQGETVRLSRGGKAVSEVLVGVGWDMGANDKSIDVDSSVVVCDADKYELVYFGHKEHSSGQVVHHGDNLTGKGEGDDERIDIYLNKLPENTKRIFVVINIYSGAENFADINNLFIRLDDKKSKKSLVQYKVTGNFARDNCVVIGEFYHDAPSAPWNFLAIGQSLRKDNVGSLSDYCFSKKWH